VAGAGNGAWSRCCDTRKRKSETTGNTNFDLHRRASPRPYLKADTVGRTAIQSYTDFKGKVKSSMHSLQRNAKKIRSFFEKDTLKYAA